VYPIPWFAAAGGAFMKAFLALSLAVVLTAGLTSAAGFMIAKGRQAVGAARRKREVAAPLSQMLTHIRQTAERGNVE
jgi:hypothetical protein